MTEEIIRKNRKDWMKRYGATAIGRGLKITDGKVTDEEAIIFFVPKKLSLSILPPSNVWMVPYRLKGYPTDVVEVTFTTRDRPTPDDRRIRPISGSLAIINAKDKGTGTLGYVNEKGEGLSNNHVMSCASTEVDCPAEIGDVILQPGAHGVPPGSSPRDNALSLLRWVTLKASSAPNECRIAGGVSGFFNAISQLLKRRGRFQYVYGEGYNRVDGAVAKATVDFLHGIYKTIEPGALEEIIRMYPPTLPLEIEIGDPVAGVGRTTGYRTGKVYAVDITTAVGMYAGNVQCMFENQVAFIGDDGPFSQPGDSGRLIYNPNELYPISLLFAGGRTGDGIDITIGNRIEDVIAELNYSFP